MAESYDQPLDSMIQTHNDEEREDGDEEFLEAFLRRDDTQVDDVIHIGEQRRPMGQSAQRIERGQESMSLVIYRDA